MLIGIGRDEPALVRVRLGLAGRDLHLTRVVDARLLLGGQRERRPDLGVLHRPLEVGVEADLHLDHPVERAASRPAFAAPSASAGRSVSVYSSAPLPLVQMKPVADAARKARSSGARGRDVDRHRLVGLVVHGRLVGPEVRALEVDDSPRHSAWMSVTASLSRANRSLCSGQSTPTGTSFIDSPVPTPRIIRPRGEAGQRRERLGDDRGVVPERGREDARAEDHPTRRLGRGTQPDERVRGVAVGVAPGLEVVARPDRVEPGLLGGNREIEQALGRELLGGRLVAEGQGRHWILMQWEQWPDPRPMRPTPRGHMLR